MAAAKPTSVVYDLYLMANVSPRSTGLPFVVHISEQQGNLEPWVRASGAACSAIVSVAAPVRVLDGELADPQLSAFAQWIAVNRDVLLGYWDRSIESTAEALAALKPVQSVV